MPLAHMGTYGIYWACTEVTLQVFGDYWQHPNPPVLKANSSKTLHYVILKALKVMFEPKLKHD